MMNRQIFIISVLSKINDKYIDTATQRRYELMRHTEKPPRRRGWILGTALAASLCLLLSMTFFLFLPNDSRQVPVYEGMTVSTLSPKVTVEKSPYTSLSVQKRPSLLPLSQLADEALTGETATEVATEAVELDPEGNTDSTMYYAEPNQTIFITVHVNNPDNYEILSFTLNGKVYSSYMFEDGSDMENLILKYNVGDAEGIVEYTIDAIKYVDGTEIKDVLMEGDRTVKVGVYTENQPHVTVSNELVGINKIALTVALTDELGLLEISNGQVMARLTEGDRILSEKELSYKELCEIIFDGLSADTSYRFEIIAIYDALDGQGVASHILFVQEHRTEKFVAFDGVSVTQDSVSFNLVWNEKIDGADILSLELYQGETPIRELPVTSTKATQLLSNTEYTLVVSYRNSGAVETVKATFTTQAKAVPQLTVTAGKITHTAISFAVNLTDPDGIGRIDKIELLHGIDTRVVEGGDVRIFENLLSDNAYTVQVTAVYDLNDGKGAQTLVKTLDVKTQAKEAPTLAITVDQTTQASVSFTVDYTDRDKVGRVTKIELLHGTDTRVVEGADVRMFKNLLSDNTYTVQVTAVYDLGDGKGAQTLVKTLDVKTQAKTKPTFTFSNVNATTDAISGTCSISDVDKVLTAYSIALYQGNTKIADTVDRNFSFADLENYTDYTVKISYRYDLSNGKGTVQDVTQISIKTRPFVDVISVMVRNTSAVSEGDTIYLQANLNNPSQGKVSSVVINGTAYPVTNSSTATRVYVEIINDGQFTGGNTILKVEKVTVSLDGILYDTIPDQPCSASVFINGKLEMLSVNYVNSKYESVDVLIPGEEAYLMFTLSNPTDYDILSLEVSGYSVDRNMNLIDYFLTIDKMLIKLDADHYLYPLTSSEYPVYNENGEPNADILLAGGVNVATWSSVSYANEYLQKTAFPTENTTSTSTCCVPISNEVKYISTPADLMDVNDWYLYELTNDIDLAGIEWRSVPFYGILDGKGYAIRNMSYVGKETDGYGNVGLFGVSTGAIRNLNIENCFFIVTTDTLINYGAICASHESYLSLFNCSVDANSTITLKGGETGSGVAAGGLASYANTVKNCVNASSISITTTSGYATAGGICGGADYVEGCTNTGAITIATESRSSNWISGGGIMGHTNMGSLIVECVNHGEITLVDDHEFGVVYYSAGGIAGLCEAGRISDCINTGHIFSRFWAGGITNTKNDACLIQNCINIGTVETSHTYSAGGIIGDTDGGYGLSIVKNCVNVGTVIQPKNEKFGVAPLNIIVENCYATTLYKSKGSTVTNTKLKAKSFWTETLGWDESIWSFDDLDFENGKYPTLRKN